MSLEEVLNFIEKNKADEQSIRTIARATTKLIQEYRAKNKGEVIVNDSDKAVATSGLSEQALALAQYMAQEVKKRYPWYTPKVDNWAEDIEKIHRLGCEGEVRKAADRFDWATIKTVTLFSQQDPFWQQQVRSGKNLRKHFNKLLIKTKKYVDDNRIETV